MIIAKSKVATFSILVLLFAGHALAGKPDKGPSGLDCDGCVDSTDLAAGAVTTDKIQDDAVTASKIATSAVGVTQVDPSQVQLRVGGACAWGRFVAAVAQDGSVTCGTGTDPNNGNTRYGINAFMSNTAGWSNTASGNRALYSNSTGSDNTASGTFSLLSNTTGWSNTAIGVATLYNNTIGDGNTASGSYALWSNTNGNYNTASGYHALYSNTEGTYNTASGWRALFSNTTGSENTAVGRYALYYNTIGYFNAASGGSALFSNTDGRYNTANGHNALYANTTGSFNTASGNSALYSNTAGSENVAIGRSAGLNLTTGDYNIVIGAQNRGESTDTYTTRIGHNQTRAFVAGIYNVNAGGLGVTINSNGQLGTVASSARYKEDINDMGEASDKLLQLRPVTFRYKEPYENGEKPLDYGLIAEEVAEVFPELVVYNDEGQPETVKYRLLSTLLLNELQKDRHTLEEQAQEMVELKTQISELTRLVSQLAKSGELSQETLVASNGAD